VYSKRGVHALELRRGGRAAAVAAGRLAPAIARLARDLKSFAAGKPVRWRCRLADAPGTPFQRNVWRVLRRIPRGQTRSYAWVARRAGRPRAQRAVGAACGANPLPIIVPCHRVVRSDGSPGGFGAGPRWKRRLLRLESAMARVRGRDGGAGR
jgi:O-6-methylguanine DNA methyltransferase